MSIFCHSWSPSNTVFTQLSHFPPPDCTFSDLIVCFSSPLFLILKGPRTSDLRVLVFPVHTILTLLVIQSSLTAWNHMYMQTTPKFLSLPNSRLPPWYVQLDVHWSLSLNIPQLHLHPQVPQNLLHHSLLHLSWWQIHPSRWSDQNLWGHP